MKLFVVLRRQMHRLLIRSQTSQEGNECTTTNEKIKLTVVIYIRCGKVMADNIAYAKIRKSLLI